MEPALLTGALDQIMRHALTGCTKAAHHAVRLLDALAECGDLDDETRDLCGRMSEHLAGHHV